MAELTTTNMTVTIAANALSVSPITNISIRDDLCNHASINKWSHYRTRPIELDGSLNVILSSAPTGNRLLGDFRRYNHQSATPSAPNDFTTSYNPGSSTVSITFAVFVERLNVRELTAAALYVVVKYYASAANRAAKTSSIGTKTFAFDFQTETVPTGHTNNQTQGTNNAQQICIDSTYSTISLSKPDDILYCDVFLGDASGGEIIRFDDTYTDVTTHEFQNPYDAEFGPNITAPAGYTACFPVLTTGASAYLSATYAESFGTTDYGYFYWFMAGIKGSTWYRLGSVSAVGTLKVYLGAALQSSTEIFNGTLTAAGASSNENDGGTLASSDTWGYDEIGTLNVAVPSWSGFTEYALPGAP